MTAKGHDHNHLELKDQIDELHRALIMLKNSAQLPHGGQPDRHIENILVWYAETTCDLSQQHEREIAQVKASLVDDLITMTKQTWDTRSPFANIENINNQMVAASSQVLLTMKERLKVELQQQSNGGKT